MPLSRHCFNLALFLALGCALAHAQCEKCSTPKRFDKNGQTIECQNFQKAQSLDKNRGTIECSSSPDGAWIWTITRPRVDQPLTKYPEINFEKGQTVFVTARGFVNVGKPDDKRADWRRYVDPEGTGTDRFYHGLVWIPGARILHDGQLLVTPVGTAPVRISSLSPGHTDYQPDTHRSADTEEVIISDPFSYPANKQPFVEQVLWLGYEGGYKHPYPRDPYPQQSKSCETAPSAHLPPECREEASVTIIIKPTAAQQDQAVGSQLPAQSTENPTRALLPLDPVSTKTDENGFMQAPTWFGNYGKSEDADAEVWRQCDDFPYKDPLKLRVSQGVHAPCTQQASFDVPSLFTHCLFASAFGVLHGHVNWVPATYVGRLRFKEVSSDYDLDMQLLTIGDIKQLSRFPGNESFGKMKIPPILTKDSQIDADYKNALWLEFASYETVKYFTAPPNDGENDSWQLFTAQRTKQDYKDLEKKYADHTAIVTGLLNLDCVHECHTELHPVFAMALRTKIEDDKGITKTTEDKGIVADDTWLIFVRNAGNEGDCSQDEHYLNRAEYTFFLPAPPRAPGKLPVISWGKGGLRSNVAGLTWNQQAVAANENGIRLKFSLAPNSKCRALALPTGKMVHISGILHLDWRGQDQSKSLSQASFNDSGKDDKEQFPGEREIYEVKQETDEPSCQSIVTSQEHQDACSLPQGPDGDTESSKQFECEQNYLAKLHNSERLTTGGIWDAVKGYIGRDAGLFEEVLLYNGTTQIQPNFAGRYAILQTALGSFEVDGAPPIIQRQVKSTNGTNLKVKISDVMGGLKIKFTNALNTYGEVKYGEIFRSASSGFEATPDFKHFQGHNGFVLIGGGIQPYGHEGARWSLRISAGWLYLPSTGEHMIRLTVGPQIRF